MTFREQLDLIEYACMGERFTLYGLIHELNATVETCGKGSYTDVTAEILASSCLHKAFLFNDYSRERIVRCRECGYLKRV